MQATDLISFVPLKDDRGHTIARFYPSQNVITIKACGQELMFSLSDAHTKATQGLSIKAQAKPLANRWELC